LHAHSTLHALPVHSALNAHRALHALFAHSAPLKAVHCMHAVH